MAKSLGDGMEEMLADLLFPDRSEKEGNYASSLEEYRKRLETSGFCTLF